MARGVSKRLVTELPERFRPGFPWALDLRSKTALRFGAALYALQSDLGGPDALSAQQKMLTERCVFLHERISAFESAVLRAEQPAMTFGEYSNCCNVLLGMLKALGLKRQARDVGDLQAYIARKAKP